MSPPSLVSPRGEDRAHRTPVKGHAFLDPERLPSTCAFRVARAPREARHRARGFAAAEPASDTWSTVLRGSSPRRRADRAPPVDFCNHHGSPARPRTDQPPRDRPGLPPARRMRAAVHLAVQGRPSRLRARGHRGRFALASASTAIARGGALPRPGRLGHLMSQIRARGGRRSRTPGRGTEVPANPPADDA